MSDQRFRRSDRLRTTAEFQRVYQRRVSSSDGVLLVYVCENDLGHARLGLSVSRKVGPAVVRNRWKRLIREAFRQNRSELPASLDLVVIPKSPAPLSLEQVQFSLIRQSGRAAARLVKKPIPES